MINHTKCRYFASQIRYYFSIDSRFTELMVTGDAHLRQFQFSCRVESMDCLAQSSTKRAAKEAAAKKMVDYLIGANNRPAPLIDSVEPIDVSTSSSNTSNTSPHSTSPESTVSEVSAPNDGENYINELLELCTKQYYPVSFELTSMSGEPHRPSFTYTCTVKDRKCEGTAANKKCAKNRAAIAMLDVMYNDLLPNDERMIPIMELPSVEETLAAYAAIKRNCKDFVSQKKCCGGARSHPFQNATDEQRRRAVDILKGKELYCSTPRDVIDAVCKALQFEYEIKQVHGHANSMRQFCLNNTPAICVLIEEASELNERVLEYFCTMLDVNRFILGDSEQSSQNRTSMCHGQLSLRNYLEL